MKPRTQPRRISPKKLKSLGGKMPFTTVTAKPKPLRKKKRTKSERERIYGPPGYVEWIHEQACVACGIVGYSECAHVGRSSGVGRKGSWRETVPLCGREISHVWRGKERRIEGCHATLHRIGRTTFERRYTVNLDQCAESNHAAWTRTRE